MYCKTCGDEIEYTDGNCPICGMTIPKKDARTAATLSLIPGLGQIYNGDILKGTSFIILDIIFLTVSIAIIMFSIIDPYLWKYTLYIILIGLLFWISNMFDAYINAKKGGI